jgi:di/tricarboxylate transporter
VSLHLIGLLGLFLAFVLGTLRPVNLGAVSLALAFLIGSLAAGESVPEILSGFPVDLFVLLAGVTYLFGVAASNGTLDLVVEAGARRLSGRRALIPWGVFVLAALPALAGSLGSAGVALLAPLALRLARVHGIDRRMVGLMVVHGAAAGNFSPLNVLSVLARIDRPGIRERIVREIGQEFGGSVIWGEDLMRLSVRPPTASASIGD